MILKVIHGNGVDAYLDIGRQFSILEKEKSLEEFERLCKIVFGPDPKDWLPETYAFVLYENGSGARPLYKGQTNFLMSDGVEMFKDLTFK